MEREGRKGRKKVKEKKRREGKEKERKRGRNAMWNRKEREEG